MINEVDADGNGNIDTDQWENPIPDGTTRSGVTISITRTCGNQPDLSMTFEANRKGRVWSEGNCIFAEYTTKQDDPPNGVKTSTKRRRKCCGDSE